MDLVSDNMNCETTDVLSLSELALENDDFDYCFNPTNTISVEAHSNLRDDLQQIIRKQSKDYIDEANDNSTFAIFPPKTNEPTFVKDFKEDPDFIELKSRKLNQLANLNNRITVINNSIDAVETLITEQQHYTEITQEQRTKRLIAMNEDFIIHENIMNNIIEKTFKPDHDVVGKLFDTLYATFYDDSNSFTDIANLKMSKETVDRLKGIHFIEFCSTNKAQIRLRNIL